MTTPRARINPLRSMLGRVSARPGMTIGAVAFERLDQRSIKGCSGSVALTGILRERPRNDSFELLGELCLGRQAAHGWWRPFDDRCQHLVVRADKREPSREQLKEENADSIEVRASVDPEPLRLLWREVGQGADENARERPWGLRDEARCDSLRQPEVEDPQMLPPSRRPTRQFCALRSRCRAPALWIAARPARSWRIRLTARGQAIAPVKTRSRSVTPRTSGITRKQSASPSSRSSTPKSRIDVTCGCSTSATRRASCRTRRRWSSQRACVLGMHDLDRH